MTDINQNDFLHQQAGQYEEVLMDRCMCVRVCLCACVSICERAWPDGIISSSGFTNIVHNKAKNLKERGARVIKKPKNFTDWRRLCKYNILSQV